MASTQPARSTKEIEADIAATRSRLARTVDELAYRVSPDTIKANDAAFTPEGDVRYDRLAKVLGGVAGGAMVLGLLRRTFNKG